MINVTKTHLPDINKYKKYVDEIYDRGWVTNNGKLVRELEDRLKEYFGSKNVILVANGSLALQVSYKALDLKGEVITTPFSFVASTSTLLWEGLTPKFADIDSETFNINPINIQKLISENTTAILPVHVYGNPCKLEEISELAKENQLKLIYDASHAFGVKCNGTGILNFGNISVISFHATKLFHTIEGGAIVTNCDDTAAYVRKLINFGITSETTIECIGTNAKMNEFQAAMGLATLDEIDSIFDRRKEIWGTYEKALKDYVTMQNISPDANRNYAYAPILLQSSRQRSNVESTLRERGINTRRYFYPSLNRLSYLHRAESCPNSESIADRILCLPIYPSLDRDIPVARIAELVKIGLAD